MLFRVAADIARSPDDVFAYLRDIHRLAREPDDLVPVLEKTSAGPVGIGSTFHEEVRVLPWRRAQITSTITRFEPGAHLDYRFTWRLGRARMNGTLEYTLVPRMGGTHLVQVQALEPRGVMRALAPLIRATFGLMLARRLRDIRRELEGRGSHARAAAA